MNPASTKSIKPVFNGKNSKTAAAPSQVNASTPAPRNKITGTQVPKTAQANLPMNRARALFAAASKRGTTASGESMGGY